MLPPPPPPVVRARLVCTFDEDDTVHLELATVEECVHLDLVLDEEACQAAVAMAVDEAVTLLAVRTSGSNTTPPAVGHAEPADECCAMAGQLEGPAADELRRQHAELLQENNRLQGLVRQYLDGISKASRKSLPEAAGGVGEGAEQQMRYTLALQQLSRLMDQKEAAVGVAAAALLPERMRAAAAERHAQAQRAALRRFVSDIACAANKAAAAGNTQAALPDRVLQHFLAAEPAKAAGVQALRAATARLAHQLAAAERRLKEADQLSAEGLHLVDFEQTRIENATLAAKCEARRAEVEKLRGKLVQAVQIAAHVREKLHYAQQERAALAEQLEAAERALGVARAELTVAKATRDRWQRERGELTQDWRIVSDKRCLEDMRAQQGRLEALQAQAEELQAAYEAGERQLKGRG